MGLFHNIRRGLIGVAWIAVGGAAFFAWQQRERFTPAVDFYQALSLNQGHPQEIIAVHDGEVIRVIDNANLTVRDAQGGKANVRLTGVAAPGGRDQHSRAQIKAGSEFLSDLVLSNQVTVKITHQYDPGALLGLVYFGDTNINVALVENGLASAEPRFMNGLPLRVKYDLFRADRKRRASSDNRALPPMPPPEEGNATNRQPPHSGLGTRESSR